MVTKSTVTELSERIVGELSRDKIILFGSRAYGTPREYSDVDLLVVLPFGWWSKTPQSPPLFKGGGE